MGAGDIWGQFAPLTRLLRGNPEAAIDVCPCGRMGAGRLSSLSGSLNETSSCGSLSPSGPGKVTARGPECLSPQSTAGPLVLRAGSEINGVTLSKCRNREGPSRNGSFTQCCLDQFPSELQSRVLGEYGRRTCHKSCLCGCVRLQLR